jgi:CRISPR-associated protein Csh1
LLFNIKKLGSFTTAIEDELQDDEIFWINFIAFESDGNFFKSTEIIKDVSNFHFNKLIRTFNEINWRYREASFVEWNKVMMDYDFETKERRPTNLNFNSLFKIIPLRKDMEKKNKALDLFKTILENRKVNISLLYDYFNELILCHFYGRYNSYTNVQQYSKDYFYIAVRDSVFKYLAFIQLLKQLNLIDMEDTNSTTENLKQYDQKESDFFNEMNLNQEQRAMFYLGRMLNQVEYIQTKDKKKKTVIEKVNFNGLEIGNIQRLRNDLNEKAKQYRLKYPKETNSVVFIDNKFAGSFDFNKWVNTPLNPQEALFFLLTGYSFGAKNNDNPPLQNDDN